MNKTELIKLLAANTGFTQDQARKFVDELVLLAKMRLQAGRVFAIHDLVEIKVVDVAARSGVAWGGKWTKPAHKALKAKVIGRARRMWS